MKNFRQELKCFVKNKNRGQNENSRQKTKFPSKI